MGGGHMGGGMKVDSYWGMGQTSGSRENDHHHNSQHQESMQVMDQMMQDPGMHGELMNRMMDQMMESRKIRDLMFDRMMQDQDMRTCIMHEGDPTQ